MTDNKKYYYVLLSKKTHKMLLQDCKLPIYWHKKIANERAKLFPSFYVKRIKGHQLADIINPLN